MKAKFFLNPFEKFNEKILLILGTSALLIGSLIGAFNNVRYDGVMDVHLGSSSFSTSLLENLVNTALVFVVILVIGKSINAKTRAIDLLNVSLISRIPVYLSAVFVNNPFIDALTPKLLNATQSPEKLNLLLSEIVFLLIFASALLLLSLYQILLLFFGFKTAVNAKIWSSWLAFAAGIVSAELLSKMLFATIPL